MRTTNYLKLSALVLGSAIAGCGGNNGASTGPSDGGTNSAGGATNAGGASSVGGTKSSSTLGGAGVGGNATGGANVGGNATGGAGVGGNATGGAGVGGNATGGAGVGGNATGGAGVGGNATGGAGVGGNATGGANVGGNATGGSKANTGGANVGGNATGGTPPNTGGTPAGTGGGTGCSHGPEVLSDFENALGTTWQVYPVTPAAGTAASGVWYTYWDKTTASCTTGQTPTPAASPSTVMASEIAPSAVSGAGGPHAGSAAGCNNYAMHSSISNCATYSGFGATLLPSTTVGSTMNLPVDYSNYDGITFWAKAGTPASGLQVGANVYVEFLAQDCKDSTFNGTAPNDPAVDHICHGRLINLTDTNWHQVFIPFYNSGPRSFPATTAASSGNGNACASGTICEPPLMNPKHLQGIQFSLEQPFDTAPTLASAYDVWIDDLALYKFSDTPADQGLAALTQDSTTVNKFPQNKAVNAACTKPAGVDGKLIQNAYATWKTNFVRTEGSYQKVISPEIDGGATVSEGIAYGMMISVYMGDKTLFDGVYNYWKAHVVSGTTLMNWKYPSGGGTSPSGAGSATDADEDAAFAVLEASKQWPSGGYSATAMISDVYTHDIDSGTSLPKGGTNYGSVNPTNPSYFSPAMYREFAKVDTGHTWSSVITAVYNAFNTGIGNAVTSGLVPAWCGGGNCSTVSTNGAATDNEYQYDSHRVPWRLALDTCWNGTTTGAAYLNKLIGFFNTQAATGLANLSDIYTTAGAKDATNGAPNSMSLIGCAGVGAMVNSTNAGGFRDRTWQFLIDGMYTDSPSFLGKTATKGGYTYYNATVGLLTMLTMSGNFYVM